MKNQICLIFLFFLCSITQNKIDAQSDFKSLNDSIKVPEIDPRQYIIIYEWEEANENRTRKGINTKYLGKNINERIDTLDRYINNLRKEEQRLNSTLKSLYLKKENLYEEKEELAIKYDFQEEVALYSDNQSHYDNILDSLKYIIIKNEIKNDINTDSIKIVEIRNERITKRLKSTKEKSSQLSLHKDLVTSTPKRKIPFDYSNIGIQNHSNIHKDNHFFYDNYGWKDAALPSWDPIWWVNNYSWSNNDFRNIAPFEEDYIENNFALIPFQKYKILDYKSTLRIVFDKTQLANNASFKGAISLEAFLYEGGSQNADPRQIEINPYSVIGVEQKTIGLSNRPADEIAGHLLEMQIRGIDFNRKARSFLSYPDNAIYLEKKAVGIERIIQTIITNDKKVKDFIIIKDPIIKDSIIRDREFEKDRIINKLEDLVEAYNSELRYKEKNICGFELLPSDFVGVYNDLKLDSLSSSKLDNLKKILDENNIIRKGTNPDNKACIMYQIKDLRQDLELIKKYIGFFDKESGTTKDAFLKLLGKDKIYFKYFLSELNKYIGSIDLELEKEIDTISTDNLKDDLRIIVKRIDALIKSKGDTPLSIAIRSLKDNRNDTDYYYDDHDHDYSDYYPKRENFNKIKHFLAKKAGETLYEELVYATIDLDLADAKSGDQLMIKMFWDKESFDRDDKNEADRNESNLDNSKKEGVPLYVAKFDLKSTGWNFQTGENAILIKRLNENLLRSNYPLDPTNFDLSGGGVMMWSYRNDKRVTKRIKFDKISNTPKFNNRGEFKFNRLSVASQKFFKSLEPSFGLNLSYLDYRTNKSFELGIGPSFGIFNNTLYFSSGINLMETKESPWYFGIGFSFVNLGTKIKEIESQNNN